MNPLYPLCLRKTSKISRRIWYLQRECLLDMKYCITMAAAIVCNCAPCLDLFSPFEFNSACLISLAHLEFNFSVPSSCLSLYATKYVDHWWHSKTQKVPALPPAYPQCFRLRIVIRVISFFLFQLRLTYWRNCEDRSRPACCVLPKAPNLRWRLL